MCAEKDEKEIEITLEMIEAGAAELRFWLDEGRWASDWIVERVLRASFGKLNLPLDDL